MNNKVLKFLGIITILMGLLFITIPGGNSIMILWLFSLIVLLYGIDLVFVWLKQRHLKYENSNITLIYAIISFVFSFIIIVNNIFKIPFIDNIIFYFVIIWLYSYVIFKIISMLKIKDPELLINDNVMGSIIKMIIFVLVFTVMGLINFAFYILVIRIVTSILISYDGVDLITDEL